MLKKHNQTMADNSIFDQNKLIDCLTKQLSELEIFQTMYTPKEIIITNREILESFRNFIEKKTVFAPNHLDYTIMHVADNVKLEICVTLPSFYPEIAPEVYVRCNQLNRFQEKSMNDDVMQYIQRTHDGEVSIFTAILWLQDNIESYTVKSPKKDPKTQPQGRHNFNRYWIYSHHIYCKKKTEEMIKLSKELHITGFCLLGKPGVICIEGTEDDCKNWWKDVKLMHWQKISLRLTETFSPDEAASQKKFKSFEILSFPAAVYTNHSDLGSLQQYMQKCGLSDQMTQFFNVNST